MRRQTKTPSIRPWASVVIRLAVPAVVIALSVNGGCDRGKESEPPSDTGQADASTRPITKPTNTPPTREASLSKIRRLILAGERDDAQNAVEAHLLRFPSDPNAMVLASGLLKSDGEIDDAVAMLDAAAEASPDQETTWRRRAASVLFEAGRIGEAIERMESLLGRFPTNDTARHELVSMLNQRGFRHDANEHTRTLCRNGAATPDELRGLMFPARSFTGLTEKPSVDNVELIRRVGALNVARAMYSEGDVVDASRVLAASELIRQRHPAAYAFYGQVLIESQQFEAFRGWYAEVPTAAKRYPAYWLALGGWAMRERQFDVAVGQFSEAILREPGDLAAVDRMTQALAAGGHQAEQERFRRRGVVIDRLMMLTREVFGGSQIDPAAVEEISELLTEVGRPLPALAWYRIALQQMGSPPAAMGRLGEALAMVDENDFREGNRRKRICGIDLKRFPNKFELSVATDGKTRSAEVSAARPYPQPVDPVFVNVASKVGIDFKFYNSKDQVEREFRLFEQLGGGVACVDYDLDGKVDFYLGQASAEPPKGEGTRPNMLVRSTDNQFVDVTEFSRTDDRGYSCGITAGDWNQDGFPDLVVANLDRNTLLINRGDGTFELHHGDAVWNAAVHTTSVAIGDVNGDHLPDIVEVNYVDDPSVYDALEYKKDGTPVHFPAPLDFQPCDDRVFLSQGDGTLVGRLLDDTDSVAPATGLGVVVADIDGTPGNEIFVANDHLANHLWERKTDGDGVTQWQDAAAVRGVAFGASGTPLGSMGIAVSDFDENGRLDFHVTNFENEWNNHYMQDGSGFFDDLIVSYGLDQPTYKILGFGTQAIDYDNNIAMDVVIGNGHVEDYSSLGRSFYMPTLMFTRKGAKFVQKVVRGDPGYWEGGHLSRALATCDWNNDGRMDFAVTDLIQPFALLENRTETPHHWMQLNLVGVTSERDAIGATVKVSSGGRTITKVVQTGDGYMCKNQSILAFGLGDQETVERLEVRWPDGDVQEFTDVAGNRRWMIIQSQSDLFQASP